MKTIEMFSKPTAKKLNESFDKTYGQKLNLVTFTLPQLEDARNRLRTQQHTMKSDANFNETVEDEAHIKTQWMLDIINQEIVDRTEVAMEDNDPASMFQGIETEAVDNFDKKQVMNMLTRFEEELMQRGAYADIDYEKVMTALESGDVEAAMEVVTYSIADQDGGENFDADALIDDLADDLDFVVNGSGNEPDDNTDDGYALASAGRGNDEDYGIYDSYDFETGQPVQENKQTKGSIMTRINESEINKASAVVSAKSMVDKVSRWIEELAGMENDTLLTLGDSIRDEMGQEAAKSFLSSIAPAIQQSLETLKVARETMASGVRGLTGEEQPEEMLGAADDEIEPADSDAMNPDSEAPDEFKAPDDDFAAAEPAAGGVETAGREQRESINRSSSLLRVLAG